MQCARGSCGALGAVALLAGLCAAAAASCQEQLPAAAPDNHSACYNLATAPNLQVQSHESCVSVRGWPVTVSLYWGSDPARAATALLYVLLRHVLRYRRVRTVRGPHRTRDLAHQVPFYPHNNYTDLVIALSTAWEPGNNLEFSWSPGKGKTPSLAGPRLTEFSNSFVPARCRLHARLSHLAQHRTACQQQSRWIFHTNASILASCDFKISLYPDQVSTPDVIVVSGCEMALQRLQVRAGAASAPVRALNSTRAQLLHALGDVERSVLFIDYDIWLDESSVSRVEPPPCMAVDANCQQELDSAISMRVGDTQLLLNYAPRLFKLVYDFKMTTKSLREILDQEARGVHIEEAACQWGLKHQSNFSELEYFKVHVYNMMIYFCNNSDTPTYSYIAKQVVRYIGKIRSQLGFTMEVKMDINCLLDENIVIDDLANRTKFGNTYWMLGVVSQGTGEVDAASASATKHRIPLVLVDVVPDEAARWSQSAMLRVAGRPRHVVHALQRFVTHSNWTRLALLSDPTALSKHYCAQLQNSPDFIVRNYDIPLELTKQTAMEFLTKLQNTNSRIVFVNANSDSATVILTVALERRMSYADGFVWIVRDWRPNNATSNITHFTISLWSRRRRQEGGGGGGQEEVYRKHPSLQRQLDKKLGRQWPPHTTSLVNAMLTLAYGYKEVFRRYQAATYDLHSVNSFQSFKESVSEAPIDGLEQYLHYKEGAIEETFVYVDEWRGDTFSRLATWRVNASSGAVRGEYQPPASLPRDDGRSRCVLRGSDPFYPECYDVAVPSALLLLALASLALLMLHRAHRRHLARIQYEHTLRTIAQRRDVAVAVESYLVQRDTLQLDHEIGAGRFGSVRRAQLRTPHRATRHVAAKALRENASATEESEFLREACIIASLDHAHIVRLVGVCITDGPPLVLMELALFGDLLGYLRARRHLVENSEELPASEEAAYVSAEELTRLAREAAAALQYLEDRGVVHRDVRAANCLVDARRSLKLADFGMARRTQAGADGAAEYACRRRDMFPVLWMAPESLAHGVFSPASDVWAFGVLLVELVTLGARPYGTMSPLRVLQYVAAGGRPPLPLDVSSDTRWLTQQCWQRAETRPSAAAAATFLAAHPRALSAALLLERDDADSGFGESPSTELLAPDYSQHSLDQLEVVAATH